MVPMEVDNTFSNPGATAPSAAAPRTAAPGNAAPGNAAPGAAASGTAAPGAAARDPRLAVPHPSEIVRPFGNTKKYIVVWVGQLCGVFLDW